MLKLSVKLRRPSLLAVCEDACAELVCKWLLGLVLELQGQGRESMCACDQEPSDAGLMDGLKGLAAPLIEIAARATCTAIALVQPSLPQAARARKAIARRVHSVQARPAAKSLLASDRNVTL